MDVQMPELNGFEATAEIRRREAQAQSSNTGLSPTSERNHAQAKSRPLESKLPRIPIIAMTAYAMKGDRERCLESGMDGYVSKPIQARELFEEIERVTCGLPRERAKLNPMRASVGRLDDLGCPATTPPLNSQSAAEAAIDLEAALARVEGDADFFASSSNSLSGRLC
jgi:CheY-like chemotaxis protein